MASNPFDFNEDEASKQFEKTVIFGISSEDSEVSFAHDFMKKSLVAANMVKDDFDEENTGLDQVSNKNTKNNFMFLDTDSVGRGGYPKNQSSAAKSKTVVTKSARSNSTLKYEYNKQKPAIQLDDDESLDEVSRNKPQVSASDFQKLQNELNQARCTIESLRTKSWTNLPAKETVKNIVTGKSYRLEGYKSLKDKRLLLDESIRSKDGNAIIAIILYIERTLDVALFKREIRKRTTACNHYIQYLQQNESWEQLEAFYKFLLLMEEAALLRYERINKIQKPVERLEELHNWIKDYGSKPEVSDITSYIQEEIGLLEKQRQLEEDAKNIQVKLDRTKETIATTHQRPSILLRPLITTLTYCALYHYDKSSKHYPGSFKKKFKVTEKQYEWAVMQPLANSHKWNDIQELLTSTNWLRRKGDSSAMGFEYVATVLYKAKADTQMISKYLSLISNTELRIKYAMRYQMHDIVIQGIVELRDRQRMEDYRLKIGASAVGYRQKINDLLNNSSIKWR